ncbi:hypothetical protein KKC13_06255 [bacterium]|nr:hypothetical protein [bacterium]MBU1958997.1 hypothetical protein [bacterium]
MKLLIPITITIALFIGCSQNTTSPLPNKTIPTGHITKSTELQTIMQKFDNLIFQHYQSELDRDRKRLDYTKEMILVVDDLVENSKELQNISNTGLTEEGSKGFLTLAKALEGKSEKLKKLVLEYKTEEIAPTLDEINSICTKCHDTLR